MLDNGKHLNDSDFKGSRYRCLRVTHLPKEKVVEFFNSLVSPFAEVGEGKNAMYMPEGFCKPDEAKLYKTCGFLTDTQCETITKWWLDDSKGANIPNWDIISKCTIGGRDGLVLVEAKAHKSELNRNDCCKAGEKNCKQINAAIEKASKGLGDGWNLSTKTHYQLSNRFAWAWKIASMGVPVVLVYLGFLNAQEMGDDYFKSHDDWRNYLLEYSKKHVPNSAWGHPAAGGTPLIPLIRSAEVCDVVRVV